MTELVRTTDEAKAYRKNLEELIMFAPAEKVLNEPTLAPVWDPNGVQYYGGEDADHPQSKVRGRTYPDKLYKCLQEHESQPSWEPDLVPALWAVIDETHAGTIDDPITASAGMEYTYGLYYYDPEDTHVYLCERTGATPGDKIVLQFLPHDLIGQYFTLAK